MALNLELDCAPHKYIADSTELVYFCADYVRLASLSFQYLLSISKKIFP
jgi:hypothetical protein